MNEPVAGQPPEPPASPAGEPPPTAFVVKVTLSSGGKMTDYFCGELNLKVGDGCLVEEDGRWEIGVVTLAKRPHASSCAKKPQPGRVIRKATPDDMEQAKRLVQKEKAALVYCKEKSREMGLKMNISRVCYSFDEKKAIFYFTAESRVDFRELVKDLNTFTRIKVELRQIGVRDEARMLGGCGPCGQELCCSRYLSDFLPVSIRMAKNQFLALSPEKISGVCGRLLCCLSYENDVYAELQKKAPKIGKPARAPDGRRGKVCQVNLLTDKASVMFEDGAKMDFDTAQFGPAGEDGALVISALKEEKPVAEERWDPLPPTPVFRDIPPRQEAQEPRKSETGPRDRERSGRPMPRVDKIPGGHEAPKSQAGPPPQPGEPRNQRRRGRRGRRRPER